MAYKYTYSVNVKVTEAQGLFRSLIKGAAIESTLEIIGEESVINEKNGQILISGEITRLVTSRGINLLRLFRKGARVKKEP